MSFLKKEPQHQSFDAHQFMQTFEQFINAKTWGESLRIVERTSLLLDPQADDLLRQLAVAQSDPRARQAVEAHHTLLRRCREVGIDQAFAEKTSSANGSGPDVLPQFRDDFQQAQEAEQRYLRTGDRAALDAAAAAWQRILDHPAFPNSDPRFSARRHERRRRRLLAPLLGRGPAN